MPKIRKLYQVCLVILSVIILCQTSFAMKANVGFDDKEIRIGTWGPMSGPAAPWGVICTGSKLVFDLINENGGIHGRQIKFYIRDDQYNPAQTKAGVKELVERKGVLAFVGGIGSSTGMAVKDYIVSNKIPWVCPAAVVKDFVFPPNEYIFGIYFLYEDEASILTQYLVEKEGYKKIGVLYQNDSYGEDGLKGVKKRLLSYGMEPVAEIPLEMTEKDVTSQILKLKESGAEAVIAWVVTTPAVIALKTSGTVGFKTQWVFPSTLADYSMMYKITGGLWEGVITGCLWNPDADDDPKIKMYREAAERLTPQAHWGTFYMAGITYSEPLAEALKRVGRDLSEERLREELDKFNGFQGIGPKITWSPTCHQGTDSCMIARCGTNGKMIMLQDWKADNLATWRKDK